MQHLTFFFHLNCVRDSFANIVDLLDDMFEKCVAQVNEPVALNYIKKHAEEVIAESDDAVERPAARLFSNP